MHPEKAQPFREAERLYKLVGVYDEGYQQAFGRFSQELGAMQQKHRWLTVRRVAAAAAVLVIASASLFYILQPARNMAIAEASGPQYDTINVGKGQIKHVLLADSSTVILNSHSRLLVSSDYNQRNRKLVLLEGEAFFDVKPDAGRPFSVVSRNMETKVLGTSFNIQAYAQYGHTRITLQAGAVSVQTGTAQQPVLLRPDEQLLVRDNDSAYTITNVRAAEHSKWTDGGLDFRNLSLQDISATLSTRYGVAFRFADQRAGAERFTASFDKEVSLEKVLSLLSTHRNIRFTQKGDTVTVSSMR